MTADLIANAPSFEGSAGRIPSVIAEADHRIGFVDRAVMLTLALSRRT
jgi:hypothetical protein